MVLVVLATLAQHAPHGPLAFLHRGALELDLFAFALASKQGTHAFEGCFELNETWPLMGHTGCAFPRGRRGSLGRLRVISAVSHGDHRAESGRPMYSPQWPFARRALGLGMDARADPSS